MDYDIKIPASVRRWVTEQIAMGRFRDEADAIAAGLRLLAERDERIERLRALVDEGLDDLARGRHRDYETAEQLLADLEVEDANERQV